MAEVEQPQVDSAPRVAPIYCGVCSLPPEYCEFQPTIAKCKEWLEAHHDDLFQKLFAGVELTEKQQKTTEKHEAKQKRAEEKKMQSKVLIKRIERTKRKYVTGVFGLEVFGIDLKAAAKKFANKFATGASVSKNNQNQDEIIVQGDVSDEIFDFITEEKFFKAVPEDNIDCIEEKRKSVK
ncbi:Translation machinery-associated protein 22 [Taphrina deformans PYCC 5710]|uniref:Translation machinery-associated protein 22 n=1 Tax=Taphrina deformans (strain PYCC 5710 / ATCC 11124 / CBS 356.35 / IMI 108563 / JCM 9778 / NBRC 8474) TaxID=1097556 RepID=R4X6H7_TAPDE|nr:Translation machinery-associated protein 22 [Taphrina deformans PYCC 5710]|eukprot:CCG80705.1 Translation machinery-associated protein 22 [Taphrina deformans PYCC 5710]